MIGAVYYGLVVLPNFGGYRQLDPLNLVQSLVVESLGAAGIAVGILTATHNIFAVPEFVQGPMQGQDGRSWGHALSHRLPAGREGAPGPRGERVRGGFTAPFSREPGPQRRLAERRVSCYMCIQQEESVPQLHVYVPEEVASVVRERARARGMTVSGYLAELVVREVASDWPEGYFDQIVGGWEGRTLRRPPQGRFEKRDKL